MPDVRKIIENLEVIEINNGRSFLTFYKLGKLERLSP